MTGRRPAPAVVRAAIRILIRHYAADGWRAADDKDLDAWGSGFNSGWKQGFESGRQS